MSGNCKTCKHNNGKQVVSKGEEPCYSCLTAEEAFLKYEAASSMTNADRIRSMSDEELAELLRDTQCNTCDWQGNDCDYADECKAEKLEMLKQECDDNGT